MIDNIKSLIKKIYRRLELSKINYLNSKFKRYIVKYEETNNGIKIFNSNGEFKIVDNTIANKVKIMDIIKDHKMDMLNKIEYYDNNKEDNKLVILINSFFVCVLGFVFIFSFFVGSYIFLYLSFIAFSISVFLYFVNIYKFLLNREEVIRLKLIIEDDNILNCNEIKDLIFDISIIIKNYFYGIIIKFINVFEKKRVKS